MTVYEANKNVKTNILFQRELLLEKVLTDDFISKNTNCSDVNELFNDLTFSNQSEFNNLDAKVLDDTIIKHSHYHSWIDFLQAAVDLYQSL